MQHYAAIYLAKVPVKWFPEYKGLLASNVYLIIFKGNGASNTLIKRQFNDESKIKILSFFVFLIQIFVI